MSHDADPHDPVVALVAREPEHRIGELVYRTARREWGLVVRYTGRVGDIDTAERWFEAIEEELLAGGFSQVLWDSRDAETLPPDARDRIWAWLEEARVLQRSAILVRSEMLRLSANLSSVGGRLKLRAFHDLGEAEAWLRRG